MTDLERQAVESYRDDVSAVAVALAAATDRDRFANLLAELVELAADWRVLVLRSGDGKLAVGELLISVERA